MPDVLHTIIDQAREQPGHSAVKDLERELTYGDLVDEVAKVGGALRQRGVIEGDRVALFLPNSVDFVVAALATLWIGALFVPLAITDPRARLATILSDCMPALVVVAEEEDRVDPDAPPPALPHGWSTAPLSELLAAGSTPVGAIDVAPRVAYAIYTSGTTGTPKGVLIGTVAFGAAVYATAAALSLTRDTRTLCVSPFHFDGSFGTLFPTLFSGGSVVIRLRELLLFPQTFFRVVASENINYTGFSPSYLRLLLASPRISRLNDTKLEIIALGGEASSLADVRSLWLTAPRIKVFNRYGPTETTIAVTHVLLTPELTANGVVPLGIPHPLVSFHLVDESGTVFDEPGRVGELYIGGAQLMEGYWNAPALSEEVLRGDVVSGEILYRTGDLVYVAKNGHYVYVDRADRVIKRSGVRISLVELSEVVRGLDGIAAAVCVAYNDDGDLGIAAFVVSDAPIEIREILGAARERLPENMLPNRIELVSELPMTNSGKVDERLLLSNVSLEPPRPL